MAGELSLPYGYHDAKYVLLLQSFLGEFIQGEYRLPGAARKAWCLPSGLSVCKGPYVNQASPTSQPCLFLYGFELTESQYRSTGYCDTSSLAHV